MALRSKLIERQPPEAPQPAPAYVTEAADEDPEEEFDALEVKEKLNQFSEDGGPYTFNNYLKLLKYFNSTELVID